MSDDLLRSARQLLAELEASEAYLRVMAAQALPYAHVIAAERRAGKRCAEILATMGAFELDLVDDATDELLAGAVRAATQPRQAIAPTLAEPATVGAYEPFDEGPEGAADEGNDLQSEESVEDEDTADGPSPLLQRTPAPAPSASDSLVSFEEPSSEEPSYISYDDSGAVESDDEPTHTPATPASSRDYDSLVSFGAVDDDTDGDDEGATMIMTGAQKEEAIEAFSSVGADALVTLEETAPDLGDALSDDDLEVLDLEEVNEDIETFDLMPDITDESAQFEDEEVTMVKAADAVLAEARQGAQGGGQQRVTSGLYGGSSVPTIRDSNEPRPRAAAIQLNAGGAGGKVLGMEEEAEPIAIGAAEDYDDSEVDLADGFSVSLQSYDDDDYDDDDYEDEDDEYEDDEVIEPVRPPEPAGPTDAEIAAIFGRAQAAAASGDLQTGADLYSDVIDADPDHVDAHVARGRLYLDLGDYSRAMSDFMVAEDIENNNPEPQVAIGDLYFARKDYRKAIEYFNAALEMSPNHAMAFCRRGISHYYRKNYREALDDLLRAQKIDPDIPNIMTYVSMAKKKAKK